MDMTISLATLLAQCAPQVAPSTMAAVVSTESKGNPFAIGVNRGRQVRQPTSVVEAATIARALLARGANLDLGLGQINSSNLRWLGLSVEAAFDPCQNVAAAARVLAINYRRAVAVRHPTPLGAALSAYNTGSMRRGYRNGYVARVYAASGTPGGRHPATPPVQLVAVANDATAPAAAAAPVPVPVGPATPPAPPAWDVFAQASSARVFTNSKGSN